MRRIVGLKNNEGVLMGWGSWSSRLTKEKKPKNDLWGRTASCKNGLGNHQCAGVLVHAFRKRNSEAESWGGRLFAKIDGGVWICDFWSSRLTEIKNSA